MNSYEGRDGDQPRPERPEPPTPRDGFWGPADADPTRPLAGYTGPPPDTVRRPVGPLRGSAPIPGPVPAPPGRALPPRGAGGPDSAGRPSAKELSAKQKKNRRRAWIASTAAVFVLLSGMGLFVGALYVESVPTPDQLELPESTTVYYADGKTPMAKLGTENRTILKFEEMNDAVKETIVAAEDQTYWTNEGVDFRSVLRAAWNNVTGGTTQGASTITQQYARLAADLTGVTYSRKVREAVIAWKLDDKYSKEEILEFYLNTVPFGRGAYGIEAAAQAFFGKTANKNAPAASQITVSEAMVLVSMVKQPEADPNDPEGSPGYDPTRGEVARLNSRARWDYVREGMVTLGHLTRAEADALTYPETVKEFDPRSRQSGLDRPTGLVVQHALSELRQTDAFKDRPKDYIQNGGYRIVTTIDKRAQDVAEASADITRPTAPEAVRGQPKNWQAALVAVEPGSGRVLAYFGGKTGTGSDYASWYYDEDGDPTGFGQHPPGSSFKVYDLAEALRQDMSMRDKFDSPATKEFPASGRTKTSAAGPIRNSSSAACQPTCTLVQATVASLNTTFFGLTEKLGAANVIDLAIRAGVDDMWANEKGKPAPVRIDLRGKSGPDVAQHFSTEVGIGQYGITVADHANGMATFAAGGKRAQLHFVRSVTKRGDPVYAEQVTQSDIGLDAERINQLNWALSQVTAAKLNNDWDSAGKTGTWQFGKSTTQNAHAWMVGYTTQLAAAVWLGTTDGKVLRTSSGAYNVFGSNYPGPIWRQFMVGATEAMKLKKTGFEAPKFPGEEVTPSSTPEPTKTATAPPQPTKEPEPTKTPKPTATRKPTPPPVTETPTATPTTQPPAEGVSPRRRSPRRGAPAPVA